LRRQLALCERSTSVRVPILPAQPVTPVLEPTRWNSVQVQQIARVALAVLAFGVAAMDEPVGNDLAGNDDPAPGKRLPELLD
jgi:hypothetical protein